ncbi:MAG: hypothetical protein A2Y21_00770 [Clostridiales bacterium GWC2_40_7]|nr:MAG: hypothetical protein A2Y21_00770 [Clostridiales bacterium GWC2_40_7]
MPGHILDSCSKFRKNIRFKSFLPKLLISYIVVIAFCICSMAALSYRLVSENIKDQAIKSNNRLLDQFRNTVDSLILGSIDELSLRMLQDSKNISYISYYFSNSLEENMYDTANVSKYIDMLKSVNPMLSSLCIYYERDNLLISSESIRHTLYDDLSVQKDLLYYSDLIHESGSTSWYVNHSFGKTFNTSQSFTPVPQSIIHMVRRIQGIPGSRNEGGAIVISLDEQVFYNIIKKTAAQDLDMIIICNSRGEVVSHTDKASLGSNLSELEFGNRILHSSESSGHFIEGISGVPSVVSFSSSGYNDWIYITVTPMEKYQAATGFLIKIILLVALTSILFGLLISLFYAFRLSNPLKKLVEFCGGINKNTGIKPQNEYNLIQSTIKNLSENMKEQEKKFFDVLPVLKDNFLQSILSGSSSDIDEIRARMQLLDIRFPYESFCTLAVKIQKTHSKDSLRIYEYEKISIAAILEKLLNTEDSMCLHCEKDGNLAVIINFDSVSEEIYTLLDSCADNNERETTAKICISLGKTVEDISKINESYGWAALGLKYSFIFPERYIIPFKDIQNREESHTCPDRILLTSMANSLRKQNLNETLDNLHMLLFTLKNGEYSMNHVMETLSVCVTIVEEVALNLNLPHNSDSEDSDDLKRQFGKIDNITGFEAWIMDQIRTMFSYIDNIHSDINRELVNKAIEYIKNNIQNRQLSQQSVASALHMSPSSLSRIFKAETGITFLDYVTNLKLDFSKELLLGTSLRIDEISTMMGYSTSQYFISRFKIKYNYTPKEYRYKFASIAE